MFGLEDQCEKKQQQHPRVLKLKLLSEVSTMIRTKQIPHLNVLHEGDSALAKEVLGQSADGLGDEKHVRPNRHDLVHKNLPRGGTPIGDECKST